MGEGDILEALRACFDTSGRYARPVNVVDLGLVERVQLWVDEDAPGAGIAGVPARQALRLTLLRAGADEDGCAVLAAQVGNRMAGVAEISRTEIGFVDAPAWGPERISGAGRRMLGLDEARFPILNNRLK